MAPRATRMISPKIMRSPPRLPAARATRRVAAWGPLLLLLLLLDAGDAAAALDALHALLHLLLRVDERSAGKHENGIAVGEALRHFDVVEIGESRLDLADFRMTVVHREDDVARRERAAAAAPHPVAPHAAARPTPPAPHGTENAAEEGAFFGVQLATREPLLHRGPHRVRRHPRRQLDDATTGKRDRLRGLRWRRCAAEGGGALVGRVGRGAQGRRIGSRLRRRLLGL